MPAIVSIVFRCPSSFFAVVAVSLFGYAVPNNLLQAQDNSRIADIIKTHCTRCHNEEIREAGVRLDSLDLAFGDPSLKLWESIQKQVASGAMPPEDETPHLNDPNRNTLLKAIADGLHQARSRAVEFHGTMRRLTVPQYRNALRDLLGVDDDNTKILPPDPVSKEGFTNNANNLLLSPLLIESYFQIAERMLDAALVDELTPPTVEHFRMVLGKGINQDPCRDTLILGANNLLLRNEDFVVTEPELSKPFAFRPFAMQRKFRFIEGYQGNDTVRGWRDFDSIYHAVFACMRGSEGYPKGLPYETVPAQSTIPSGLLLRPAIPSSEIFGESNTYGPHANFKISLRELPDRGQFRVKVRAAKYNDGLLLDWKTPTASTQSPPDYELNVNSSEPNSITLREPGIYQVEAYQSGLPPQISGADASQLNQSLVGWWKLDGSLSNDAAIPSLAATTASETRWIESPFGKALSFNGYSNDIKVPNHPDLNVGQDEFTVAAWIYPRELRQGGILCRGGYGYRHGWLLDMPSNDGILRIETANRDGKHNGTVQSAPGIIKINQWQHVAAVVQRRAKQTILYVNGFEVARGSIDDADLNNPTSDLHVGRIQDSMQFLGEIDEVFLSRRALRPNEIQALVAPGAQFAYPPFPAGVNELTLQLGERFFTGSSSQGPFLAVRLASGPLDIRTTSTSKPIVDRLALRRVDEDSPLGKAFRAFESRSPELGVHVGLRRDCGSTMNPVGSPQRVANTSFQEFIFEGAISNFPSPDVEPDNVNYLAGIREIGVRSEFTDHRDMPRLLIESIEFEGPYFEMWPPQSHQRIMGSHIDPSDRSEYAKDVLNRFAERAYRRPLNQEERQELFDFWSQTHDEVGDLRESIRRSLVLILTSPQFLFLSEASHSPEPEDLDAWELASKLSFFLWNRPPDERLLSLAANNQLHDQLGSEVDRMIDAPEFAAFAENFTSQWLGLEKLEIVETDSKRFPNLTRDVKVALRNEPIRFMEYAIRKNLPVRSLIQSDTMVVNDVVASYYGIGDAVESGFEFLSVPTPREFSGGILTQAAILAGLSDGREANPVKRGAWFARRIIAAPPEDPPPNVPKLEDLTQLSLRERLERHRNVKGCVQCHNGIDPWGLPFEAFDAGGLKKSGAFDAQSDLPTGQHVADFAEFQQLLSTKLLDQVTHSVVQHLTVYAIGRSLTYNEARRLKERGSLGNSPEPGMRDIIHEIVRSDFFLKK